MNVKRGVSIIIATALCTSGVTGIAVAQTGARLMLEEIIVTSRRYEENLQDAPLAVTAMTDDFIQNQKLETIDEMMRLVPGGSFANFAKLQPNISLRGVNSATPGNATLEASIQMVVDGVVNSKDSMKAGSLYDVERIEIMRGPQGTTFGRNASVGLIHLISKRPTREFEAGVNVTAGSDELFEVDGFFSGPLSDTVSGRVAYNFDTSDGAMESISTGDGLDGDENIAIRGSLLFEPNDNFTAYLKAEYSSDDDAGLIRRGLDCENPYIATAAGGPGGGWGIDWTPDCDPFKAEISTDRDFFLKRDILTLTAELAWNVSDDVTVTSITGFLDGDADSLADVHGSPENLFFQAVRNDVEIFSEEIRIDNHASGSAFRYLAGLYFLSDEDTRFEDNQFGFTTGPSPLLTPTSRIILTTGETDSIAVFGELSFDLSDEWNLTVGGRFTDDERDVDYRVSAYGDRSRLGGLEGCAPPATLCGTEANPIEWTETANKSWDNFSGKVSLQYDLSDTSMIYGLYSEGFLSGGFQHDAINRSAFNEPFEESTTENFELGWKADFERARVAVTLFHFVEKDSQVGGLIPTAGGGFTSLISNIGEIESDGIEVEGTWLATDNIRLGGSVAFIDAEFVDAIVVATRGGALEDISGLRPRHTPEETAAIYAEYTVNLGGGSTLMLRADYTHRSDIWSSNPNRGTIASSGEFQFLRPKLNDYGVRATWISAGGQTRVMLWGKNLNEDYDIVSTGPPFLSFQRPEFRFGKRTYGVTASFTF